MTGINQALGSFLGLIMRICFNLVNNYGLAIILFTLVSKLVLLPVSLWVHNNSIRMVHMQPAINSIKVRYFGDKDRIAEEQHKLYKEEKYNPLASILPLLLQLVLLAGIIEVINHPLTYLFSTPKGVTDAFLALSGKLASINLESSSAQLAVIDLIKNSSFTDKFLSLSSQFPPGAVSHAVTDAQDLNMMFLGFNLSWIPNTILGKSIIVPALAGVSAWFLAFVQNKVNVLQSEQSNLNKYGMMIFSVALSLFLGWFVPVGVAVYWIFSNLFAVLQLLIFNKLINPRDHIDYDALTESKLALTELELLEPKASIFRRDPNRKREKEDYKRFFSIANKHLVFYSEASGFYKYFQSTIEYLLKHTNLNIHYVTNDPNDAIFQKAETNPQVKAYYIGAKRIITLMMKMDADLVVTTTPDIENHHIKKSYIKDDIEYVYTFHGMGSTNLGVNKGAYDSFDTLFCVGQHQINEIRETENMYNLPAKNLIPSGYGLYDKMLGEYAALGSWKNNPKIILIAPSWNKDNLLDCCIDEMLENLLMSDYYIIVRPHPEYIKRYPVKIAHLQEKYRKYQNKNLDIQVTFSSNSTVYTADVLITDWSNISFEYSYTTKQPTLFINTPMKVLNPEYYKYKNQPIDITTRDEIGLSLDLDKLNEISSTIDYMLKNRMEFKEKIENTLQKNMFNIGKSGEIGAKYLINQLQNK